MKRMLVVSIFNKILLRMLAPAFWRNGGDGSLDNLEQRLLNTFTRNVPRQ